MPEKEYIKHPLIKENTLEARLYQQLLAVRTLQRGNTLIVAPTALGKTIVAILVAAERLKQFPKGKVLMLAPTKPLALQHAESFRRFLKIPPDMVVTLTGSTPPEKRKRLWEFARVITATPQTIQNDILTGNISLKDVVLLVFDEAHRAVGEYPYVFIAKHYMNIAENPLILGLTASPGGTEERIEEVRQNLFIKNIEIKTPYDPDVRPYVHKILIRWVPVELPEAMLRAKKLLENAIRRRLRILKELEIISSADPSNFSRKDYLALQKNIMDEIAQGRQDLWDAAVAVGGIIKLEHALELLETQGVSAFLAYMDRLKLRSLQPRPPKSLRDVLQDPDVIEAWNIAKRLQAEGIEHPKLRQLIELVRNVINKGKKCIVFVQFRDTANRIVEELSKIPGVRAVRFVGQAKRGADKGLSQKEQQRILQDFKHGVYNVLVATSVAEEGLDIPAVDAVIFYEAVPSEIRFIQRRGRTGRFGMGEVYVLISKGTRDEAYYWAAKAKEKKMIDTLLRLRKTLSAVYSQGQASILDFVERPKLQGRYEILADIRERGSKTLELLFLDPELKVSVKQLPLGDYVVSEAVAIERKSAEDFIQSIIDGRLFDQAKRLSESYARPIVIVEGELSSVTRNVHPNAVRGAIISLITDFGVGVIFSKGPEETTAYIKLIAKREQEEKKRLPRLRGEKRIMTLPEMQQYIVESLPFVGPKLARELLKTFGTVEKVMTASERELARVEGIGPKRAKEIRRVLTTPYKPGEEGNEKD